MDCQGQRFSFSPRNRLQSQWTSFLLSVGMLWLTVGNHVNLKGIREVHVHTLRWDEKILHQEKLAFKISDYLQRRCVA